MQRKGSENERNYGVVYPRLVLTVNVVIQSSSGVSLQRWVKRDCSASLFPESRGYIGSLWNPANLADLLMVCVRSRSTRDFASVGMKA